MDEIGGSGQPRSGTDESAERHAGSATPAQGPTRPDPTPHEDTARHAAAPEDGAPEDAAPEDSAADNNEAANGTADNGNGNGSRPADDGNGSTSADEGDGNTTAGDGNMSADDGNGRTPADNDAAGHRPADNDAAGHRSADDRAPEQDATSRGVAGSRATEPGTTGLPAEDGAPGRGATEDRAAQPGTRGHAAADGRAAEHRAADEGAGNHGATEPGPAADDGARHHRATEPGPADTRRTPHAHTPDHTPDRSLAHSGAAKGTAPARPAKDPRGGLLMGRPFGVPVYVAPSWFLVAALITWVFGGQLDRVLPELGAARYLVSLFFAVAFYASVLVHELAHTVAALRFKLPVRRIQLQFFGGVSEIEKEAETPGREFVLAFVGPLLSLILAAVFFLAVQGVEPGTVPGVLLAGLMISNLIVAAFNLLPGLPLDGGRMLRAVVWKITGKPMSGTIAAAWVGRALAVAVLIGLPLLTQSGALGSDAVDNVGMDTVMDALLAAILAAIIWTGAGNSLRMARLREHLPELRARNLTRRAVPVETDTPLSEALRRANAAGARALVVVDAEGHPHSLVREAAIAGVPEHRRPWVAVSGLAHELTDGMRVSAELAGEDLLDALRATPATEYLVVEESGEIYGVLSAADVERAFVKAMARPS
ncbi:peptidase [Streptomyces luteolifulvus]|uniref:Peptidase n=2 Tax=Streptomyces luteolifulvus TaxID=2615112 RepID=A0A6H9V8G5_9ACTN|nr:site-2 protease family protein [Streptomyces luteolifulvus]KAB1150593.1 peptidase [Streptomyces luteolifulvus]